MIGNQLEKTKFPRVKSQDYLGSEVEIEVENQQLRRLYQVLSNHEIGNQRFGNTGANKCNSLIYKSLYSSER